MKAAINQEIRETLMTAAPTTTASFFPPLDRKVLIALALSGVAATTAFDVFGQILSPAAGFVELAPSMHTISAQTASLGEDPATARREATSDSAYEHTLACANPMTI